MKHFINVTKVYLRKHQVLNLQQWKQLKIGVADVDQNSKNEIQVQE